jgi:ABC-type multidrug transport system ATPase subunit
MNRRALLEAHGLAKRRGGRAVLTDVTLRLAAGEMVGIVGENGAGKSTLLEVLAGLLRPDRGALSLSARLGYCPQEAHVFGRLTLRENLALFASAYGLGDWSPRIAPLLKRFRLTAGLDRQTYLAFWKEARALCEIGRAVLVVAHFLDDRAPLDRVLTLSDGRLT